MRISRNIWQWRSDGTFFLYRIMAVFTWVEHSRDVPWNVPTRVFVIQGAFHLSENRYKSVSYVIFLITWLALSGRAKQ
ncbi:hypothetical protein, partial [Hydrocoleum sp. CS-953]|uniref:hypothetical protein n=1 Tax=Hydrocoleum sp. CS-953 TaxID=1671698 RepID=UPI001AF00520